MVLVGDADPAVTVSILRSANYPPPHRGARTLAWPRILPVGTIRTPAFSHFSLPHATDFTPDGPENSYGLRYAFFGSYMQLQGHDSRHLTSSYTDYSFSSRLMQTKS